MEWDTSTTLYSSSWNYSVGVLSSCVTNNIRLDHVSQYSEHFWNTLYRFLMYLIMFLMYCYLHAYFSFRTYIIVVGQRGVYTYAVELPLFA